MAEFTSTSIGTFKVTEKNPLNETWTLESWSVLCRDFWEKGYQDFDDCLGNSEIIINGNHMYFGVRRERDFGSFRVRNKLN